MLGEPLWSRRRYRLGNSVENEDQIPFCKQEPLSLWPSDRHGWDVRGWREEASEGGELGAGVQKPEETGRCLGPKQWPGEGPGSGRSCVCPQKGQRALL